VSRSGAVPGSAGVAGGVVQLGTCGEVHQDVGGDAGRQVQLLLHRGLAPPQHHRLQQRPAVHGGLSVGWGSGGHSHRTTWYPTFLWVGVRLSCAQLVCVAFSCVKTAAFNPSQLSQCTMGDLSVISQNCHIPRRKSPSAAKGSHDTLAMLPKATHVASVCGVWLRCPVQCTACVCASTSTGGVGWGVLHAPLGAVLCCPPSACAPGAPGV
jgi:hypothetical protein